jgi:hypothetical protein
VLLIPCLSAGTVTFILLFSIHDKVGNDSNKHDYEENEWNEHNIVFSILENFVPQSVTIESSQFVCRTKNPQMKKGSLKIKQICHSDLRRNVDRFVCQQLLHFDKLNVTTAGAF